MMMALIPVWVENSQLVQKHLHLDDIILAFNWSYQSNTKPVHHSNHRGSYQGEVSCLPPLQVAAHTSQQDHLYSEAKLGDSAAEE